MTPRRSRTPPPPLHPEGLNALALRYVGRYATSRAGLVRYLSRKLAERGWDDPSCPDPAAIAERFAALGYVDDAALAEARSRSLGRRGYGAGRVRVALGALGIAEADGATALEEARDEGWDRALRFAERRRIGPYARAAMDDAARRRAFAAMMRAGHAIEHARKIIAALPGNVPDWNE